MDPKNIGKAYDQLAAQWVNESFSMANGIAQHERAIAFLKQKRRALDIGCGSNVRFIELLLANGFAAEGVEGVDISERMLELARERQPNVRFHHADICTWNIPQCYDFISAWDSIWHVPLSAQVAVMTKIVASLELDGVFIFSTGGVDGPAEKTDSYMGPEMYYSVLGIPRLLDLLNELGCVCRHLEYDQHPELHLYIIAQKR